MNLSRWLIYVGIGLIGLGFLVWVLGKTGLDLGRLPGDLRIQKEKFGVYFPIVTCIILSVLFTLLINFLLWLFRK
ncbi:MAG: DUF2905 domain-containing protein [Chlamydiota bacterium]